MKKLSSRLKRIIFLAIALILVVLITNPATMFFLPASAKASLSNLWHNAFGNVGEITSALKINWISIFQIVLVILFMVLVVNVIRFIIEHVKPKSGKVQSIFSLVDSFLSYAAAIIGLIWCLSAIGINLSTIFASLGIVALIIGFAAESLIADIITGIFLVFEDDFNVGDIVEYSGFRGTVDSIGIRVTCIKDGGGNVKIVNNSDIRGILNRSKSTSRAVCDIPISYNANLEEVEVVLKKILAKLPEQYPDQFPSAPDYVGVQALGASSVDLRVSAQVSESNLFSATRIMNREIKIGFDKAGVEIPFQQIAIHKAED
jgi:small conductance mechanosensitive channel